VELSEFIQRKITRLQTELTAPLFSSADISLIHGKIAKINITDPKVRAEHIEQIKKRSFPG
jgi:hypothetical protein